MTVASVSHFSLEKEGVETATASTTRAEQPKKDALRDIAQRQGSTRSSVDGVRRSGWFAQGRTDPVISVAQFFGAAIPISPDRQILRSLTDSNELDGRFLGIELMVQAKR
jgi:hypothetical protein